MSAIFNWILDGNVLFTLEGLDMPATVVSATSEYNRESDRFGQFVEECLETGEMLEVRTAIVYARYQQWCNDNGYRPENVKGLNQALSTKFSIVRKRPKDGSGGPTPLLIGVGIAQGDDIVKE